MSASGEAWKSEALVHTYLESVRGAIPLAREQIDVLLRLVEARSATVESIADLGCGNGILSMALLDRYPDAVATLVDHSEPMISEARSHLAAYASRCDFITADLSEPGWVRSPGDTGGFDVVVSGYAIHHLSDARKRQLYGEIFDLLKPGGLFVNTEHVDSPTEGIGDISDDLLIDSLHTHQSRIGSDKTREQVAVEFVHRPDKVANILAPVESQCEWLRDCGFQDVDCYLKIFEFAMFGGRRPL